MHQPRGDLTVMLARLEEADPEITSKLLALVYDELRSLAAAHLRRERNDHTLQATALVHEAYLRLIGPTPIKPKDRVHFFALAAQAIRRVLIDYARARNADKRAGQLQVLPTEGVAGPGWSAPVDLLELHDALEQLAATEPRHAQIVEMRFFGGMTVAEVAAVLDISERTVVREWRVARAWLYRVLGPTSTPTSSGDVAQSQTGGRDG